jgi:hypothetical protein
MDIVHKGDNDDDDDDDDDVNNNNNNYYYYYYKQNIHTQKKFEPLLLHTGKPEKLY